MNNPNAWFRIIQSLRRAPFNYEAAPLPPRELPPSGRTPVSPYSDFYSSGAVTNNPTFHESGSPHLYQERKSPEVTIPLATNAMATTAHRFNFSFPNLETLVAVEKHGESIVIHATRDTFSAERKESFIRELAAEGFIQDDFRWFSMARWHNPRQVRWLIAEECPRSTQNVTIQRIVTGVLVAMALLCMGSSILFHFTGH
jgi:hypothetical protein